MLNIQDLFFSFCSRPIINGLSLSLHAGEICTLIGPSGSGKTTLLKLLTGLILPQSGQISITDIPAPKAFDQAALMMQDDLLLPWRTVFDNLMLVGELGKGAPSKQILRKEALQYLEEMGLAPWLNAYPHELSGGMRQRVSLTRALLQKRPLLLLDEPFAALDVGLREQMHHLLKTIRQNHGTTMLMVTHDFRDALSLSDRILLLDKGQISQEWAVTPDACPKLLEEMRTAIVR